MLTPGPDTGISIEPSEGGNEPREGGAQPCQLGGKGRVEITREALRQGITA